MGLANVKLLICFTRPVKLHKPMYLLICNLAVVDIMITSSVIPTIIGVLFGTVKSISYVPCLIQMFVYHWSSVMEMFALAFMAFDRVLAVSYPFQYHNYLTNARTLITASILWLSSACIIAVTPATVIPLPHCYPKLKVGLVLTLEEWYGVVFVVIIGPPFVNPFVYCLRTKEIRFKLMKVF
ncbi:olfactory receptor 4D11-like [Salarias fasciatus]|uniref:olfactory receptor 4D11-like n=1 Tax=Salarias fasciatus TaxID=181472 RepID=UPI001176D08D|nr:olfactory receptor 4D11-like [Salarias fasciatus]